MRTKNLIHPGVILFEDYMQPLGLSQNRLAMELRVPVPRINALVHGKRSITADTAIRLGRYFKTTPEFWMNLQMNYDLGLAKAAAKKEKTLVLS